MLAHAGYDFVLIPFYLFVAFQIAQVIEEIHHYQQNKYTLEPHKNVREHLNKWKMPRKIYIFCNFCYLENWITVSLHFVLCVTFFQKDAKIILNVFNVNYRLQIIQYLISKDNLMDEDMLYQTSLALEPRKRVSSKLKQPMETEIWPS